MRQSTKALSLIVGLFLNGACGVVFAADSHVAGVDPEFSALIARCAPTVNPETMAAVISAESSGHQYAIADAGPVNLPWARRTALVRSYYLGSLDAAVAKVNALIANKHTVSLGLAQVNDRNLAKLGLSVKEVFEPCTNLGAGGKILTDFYNQAVEKFGPGTKALHAAISAYNSGDWLRGANDGYVGLVYRQVGKPLSMKSQAVATTTKASPAPPKHSAPNVFGAGWTHPESIGVKGHGFAMTVSDFHVNE